MEKFNNIFESIIYKTLTLLFISGFALTLGSALFLNDNVRNFLGSLIPWGTGNVSTIDPNHFAYAENLGWIDFNPTYNDENHSITVADIGLTGYAYSENAGWIHLDYDDIAGASNTTSTNWGVTNDGAGNLGGYAYAENLGWIDFGPMYNSVDYGVKIDSSGIFSGYAYSENAGWISFNCSNTNTCSNNGGYDYKVISDGQYYNQVSTTLTIETQPAGAHCYQVPFVTQPSVLVKDQYGVNMVNGTVTASVVSGTGVLTGTSTAAITNGVATFSNLGYSLANQGFTIAFTIGSATETSGLVGPLTACAAGSGADITPVIPEPVLPGITTPGTTPTTDPEIINYVSGELQKIRDSLNRTVLIFNQPTTMPPSNLQPTQPPSATGPSVIVVDNKNAIILVLQKLLQALLSLLRLSI